MLYCSISHPETKENDVSRHICGGLNCRFFTTEYDGFQLLLLCFDSITLCLCATRARMNVRRATLSPLSSWSRGSPAVCRCLIRYALTHTRMPFNTPHTIFPRGLPASPSSPMWQQPDKLSLHLVSVQHLFRRSALDFKDGGNILAGARCFVTDSDPSERGLGREEEGGLSTASGREPWLWMWGF